MPYVEVTVAEVRQKARETQCAARDESPPRPRRSLTQGKGCEPKVQDRNGNERASKCDAIVKHEAHYPAVRESAQFSGRHAQVTHIVRKKLSPEREEDREHSGEQQRDCGQR